MTRACVVIAAVLVACAAVPAARAAFSAPVELATAPFVPAAAADTDAAGSTSVVVAGVAGGPLLVQRPAGGAWQAGVTLPGAPPSVVGPVIDAAGDGALGIAWRVDRPRSYSGIAVAVRDPHGSLSEPIAIAGPEANGARHPALAVDGAGDALLAYNADTRTSHLNRVGAIAIAYRRGGGSFSTPVVVDRELSSAPAVALAPDGTGVVAWVRAKRVHAVSVGADGNVGAVKAFRSRDSARNLVAAAGSDGAAALAWTSVHQFKTATRFYVHALRRAPGHAFGAPAVVAAAKDFLPAIAMAADETGRATVAWSEEHFGKDDSVGNNGITSAIMAATAAPRGPFGAATVIAPDRDAYLTPPAIAAAHGRVALAWGAATDLRHVAVRAAVGPAARPGQPQTVVSETLTRAMAIAPVIRATLADSGTATVVYGEPVEGSGNPALSGRLLAADGR